MVEKMHAMNLVVPAEEMHPLIITLLLTGRVALVDASQRMAESAFFAPLDAEKLEEHRGLCRVESVASQQQVEELIDRIEALEKLMGPSPLVPEEEVAHWPFERAEKEVEALYEALTDTAERRKLLEKTAKKLSRLEILEVFEHLDLDFLALQKMTHFVTWVGTISREHRIRLEKNEENVAALFFTLETQRDEEVLLVVVPKDLADEVKRVLRSVFFEPLVIPDYLAATPDEMVKKITAMAYDVHFELRTLEALAEKQRIEKGDALAACKARVLLEAKVLDAQRYMVCTEHFVYLSGWVPASSVEAVRDKIKKRSPETVMAFEVAKTKEMAPPTSLKNHRIFAPFEALVSLYGVPTYDEVDPTPFVALTYSLLFGAMFGDLGQGLVLALAGFFLARRTLYGKILLRLGLVSAGFGFFYDSFFGYEHVISHWLPGHFYFRPIENTDRLLLASVVLGLFLLTISYTYSLVNKWRQRDLEEALFGRNGLAGFGLFAFLIVAVVQGLTGQIWLPGSLVFWGTALSVGALFFKEPLARLLTGERPLYEEGIGGSMVESGFDLFESLLSLFSSSLSFVRVGAFALNHVGLFVAFHTLADLIGGWRGEISMMILGNVIVIFLEGLIVLIQSLRLIYYEMFSKYYGGEGIPFEAGAPSRLIRGGEKA